MKRIMHIMFIAIAMFTLCLTAEAQNTPARQRVSREQQGLREQRVSREQLARTQAGYIAGQLNLDDSQTAKFIDTYCDYQKELWALGPRPGRRGRQAPEADAGKTLEDRFEQSQKILDLRKKYYKKYSRFLSQQQIEKAYRLERQMMNRLFQHGQKRGGMRR